MSNRTDSGQKNITGLCRIECLALFPMLTPWRIAKIEYARYQEHKSTSATASWYQTHQGKHNVVKHWMEQCFYPHREETEQDQF